MDSESDYRSRVRDALGAEGVDLLRIYERDLARFNRGQNLVSRRASGSRIRALIEESVLAAGALSIKDNQSIMDLGSGAGIPGIPTALIHRSSRMVLLERRAARCDFLRREILALGLGNVDVYEGDASEAALDPDLRGRFAWVLLKAVAEAPHALELARPFLAGGARAVVFQARAWRPADHVDPRRWCLETEVSLEPEIAASVFVFEPAGVVDRDSGR
jgi:16S rRNA (guanine527-N7)-methyltransferase